MLRVDPRQRDRLLAITANLTDRIAEAKINGWLGEVQGLNTSLQAAQDKLAGLNKSSTVSSPTVGLGMPVIRGN